MWIYFFIFTSLFYKKQKQPPVKKVFLKILQISQENTCVGVFFGLQLYQKETTTQVFFCEICEIFRSTYFEERL